MPDGDGVVPRTRARSLAIAGALALAAAALAGAAGGAHDGAAERAACARVQALVGGHGLGAVTVNAWCGFTFDPRSQPVCSCPVFPVPGGPCFCPDHAATVLGSSEDPRAATLPVARPRRR